MFDWLTYPLLVVAVIGGIFTVVWGLSGKLPNDYTLGIGLLTTLGLVILIPVAIVASFGINPPVGDALEYWMYHITGILMIAAATGWSLIERNRWSAVVLGFMCLAIAVMVYRMNVIWHFG